MASKIVEFFDYHSFLRKPSVDLIAEAKENARVAYITVAFNNEKSVNYQIQLLKKFERSPFHHYILDNSSDTEKSILIKQVAIAQGALYVRVPPHSFKNAMSHAVALNWICKNVLPKRSYTWTIFLDHDIFPIAPTSFCQKLEEYGIYGRYQERDCKDGSKRWYLWPGLCGFHVRYLPLLDFRTTKWGDTGSRSWTTIYKQLELSKLKFTKDRLMIVSAGNIQYSDDLQWPWLNPDQYHSSAIDIFDDEWYHLINGSNLAHIDAKDKTDFIYRCLDEILKKE